MIITANEMTKKIEDIQSKYYDEAVEHAKTMFPCYDQVLADELLTSGLKGQAHTEMVFATDPIDMTLGTWCEITQNKNGNYSYTQHHALPVPISDYASYLRKAGYSVSVSRFTLDIFSKSGKTNYGKREFCTLYVSI